jgi:CO/xanthine dehydrogenase Mo-binding subunit
MKFPAASVRYCSLENNQTGLPNTWRLLRISSSAPAWMEQIEARRKGAADLRRNPACAIRAHGAVFAEVKVDSCLGQVRVTRPAGAFAAGRIINPRLVRSQPFGGRSSW